MVSSQKISEICIFWSHISFCIVRYFPKQFFFFFCTEIRDCQIGCTRCLNSFSILFFCSISDGIWKKQTRFSLSSKWSYRGKNQVQEQSTWVCSQEGILSSQMPSSQEAAGFFWHLNIEEWWEPIVKKLFIVMNSTMSKWTEISSLDRDDELICNSLDSQRILAVFGFKWERNMLWPSGKKFAIKRSSLR